MENNKMLIDLNFKKLNISNEIDNGEITLIESELKAYYYDLDLQLNKLEEVLDLYSKESKKNSTGLIKILLRTKRINGIIKKIKSTLNSEIALSTIFSENSFSEAKDFFSDFDFDSKIEKFSELKKQITFLSYKRNVAIFSLLLIIPFMELITQVV